MITLQVDSELEHARQLCWLAQPERILEIGVYQGGTLKVWLENAATDAQITAVDMNLGYLPDDYDRTDPRVRWVEGQSQSPAVIEQIREGAPYDWVFIDGDHGHTVVQADIALCLPLVKDGGYLLMHDIVSETGGDYGPGHALNQLEAAGHTVERIVQTPQEGYDGAHGIGIVHL